MIEPILKDEVLLDNIKDASKVREELHVWWLGQSGFLIQCNENHLLFDPYLSDSLTQKYAETDKPHVRMTELVIDPARLDCIDVVTSTHNHTDHLDAETLLSLMESNPNMKLVIPEANRAFVADRLKCDTTWPIGMNDNESKTIGPFKVCAVPAAHETVERDEKGRCRFVGYIAKMGPYVVYHSGDTMLFPGMEDILTEFNIDIAILPINGRAPERRVSGNLWGDEAARLAHTIGAKLVIPCHYDMFEFNTETPDVFISECKKLDQPFKVLQCGERFTYSRPGVQ